MTGIPNIIPMINTLELINILADSLYNSGIKEINGGNVFSSKFISASQLKMPIENYD